MWNLCASRPFGVTCSCSVIASAVGWPMPGAALVRGWPEASSVGSATAGVAVAAGAALFATGVALFATGSWAEAGVANAIPAARRIEVNPSMRIVYLHPVPQEPRAGKGLPPVQLAYTSHASILNPF